MDAGDFRHRVRFDQKTSSESASGQKVVAWTSRAVVWAAVEPLRGREYLEAYKGTAPVDTKIRIRFPHGFSPTAQEWRAVHLISGAIYNIHAVINPALRNRLLELMCSTGSNDGR